MQPDVAVATIRRLFPTALSIEVAEPTKPAAPWWVSVEMMDGAKFMADGPTAFMAVRALWQSFTGEDALPSDGLTDGLATTASAYEPVTLRSLAAQVRAMRDPDYTCKWCGGTRIRQGMPPTVVMPCPVCNKGV